MLKIKDIFNQIKFYLKKYGILKTIKKCLVRVIAGKKYNINKTIKEYKEWIERNEPKEEELKNQKKTKFSIEPKISIIVPMYNTKELFFKDLVECLKNQTYSNWEL